MRKKIAITLVVVLLIVGSFLLWRRFSTDRYVEYLPSTHHAVEVDQSRPTDEDLEYVHRQGVLLASEDWEKKSVYLISQGDEEEGTTADGFKYRYRFHRDMGFRFNWIYGGHINRFCDEARKLGYDLWVREKVKKEGIPKWSHREHVTPLNVMVDYLTGKNSMTLVDKFPFKISEKIYLRMGAKRPLGNNFTQIEIVYKNVSAAYKRRGTKSNDAEAGPADSIPPGFEVISYRDYVSWFNVYPHRAVDKPVYFARYKKDPETMIFRVGDIHVVAFHDRTLIAKIQKALPSKADKKRLLEKAK